VTLLEEAGAALYGPRWQTDLAHALGVSDRTIRRWIAGGDASIPESVWADIAVVLDLRGADLADVRRKVAAQAESS
jgi:hypothetical protein